MRGRQSGEKEIKERELVREKEVYYSLRSSIRIYFFITSHLVTVAATTLNSIT